MDIIRKADFTRTPWKNGGGLTSEIARMPSGDGFAWRLSIADVASDGPFSLFPGLSRILTVIDGRGMILSDDDGSYGIEALPNLPIAFSGDASLAAHLIDGPCRDFNVIFDARYVTAGVSCFHRGITVQPPQQRTGRCGILVLSGKVPFGLDGMLDGGDFCFLLQDDKPVVVPEMAGVLVVDLVVDDNHHN